MAPKTSPKATSRARTPPPVEKKPLTTTSNASTKDNLERSVVKKSTDWAKVGNVANAFILFLTAVYAIAVVGHGAGWWVLGAFGKNWAADGFCISFKNTYAHTHLLCFYGDSVFTAILLWLTRGPDLRSELQWIKRGAIAVFFHGVAHGLLWVNEQWGVTPKPDKTLLDASTPSLLTVAWILALFAFWGAFLCMNTPLPRKITIAQTVVHSAVTAWFVPFLLLFCYVNTVLFLNLTGAQMYYGHEGQYDIYYALVSLVSSIVMAATWAEPYFCDAGLVNLGGHILFDYSIPLSYIAYFALASKLPRRKIEKTA